MASRASYYDRFSIRDMRKYWQRDMYLYLMTFVGVIWLFIFHYLPLYGIIVAFKRFNIAEGIWGSRWVGLRYFQMFIEGPYFFRTVRNTVVLGSLSFLWSFWPPIVLALLFNELKNQRFKKIVQTVTYFPNFISTVIVVGLLVEAFSHNGLANQILALFGVKPIAFLASNRFFRPLYIASGIWQGLGAGTIIYLATIAGINPEMYESAVIEGADRFQQMRFITLPTIIPTITIMLIFSITGIVSVGFEKVILLYNPAIYEVADVVSTYTYRVGIQEGMTSYGAAVGLLNQAVSLLFLVTANALSRRFTEYSIW